MKNPFNFPSVDHLVEGRDYRVVGWDFADGVPVEKQKPEEAVQPVQQNAPATQAPAQPAAPQNQAPFAAPAQQPQQGTQCKPDEKMTFGVCRKTGAAPKDENDFDSTQKTDEEKSLEAEAKKQGSDVKNNKPVMVGNKKYGWAIKNGKNVLVEWGSVAGAKQPAPQQPPAVKGASGGPKPLTGQAQPAKPNEAATVKPQPPKSDPAAKIAELQQAMKVPGLPPAAQKALQNAIDLMGA
jgi:hypothetical protein